jgi:hypothetical protein
MGTAGKQAKERTAFCEQKAAKKIPSFGPCWFAATDPKSKKVLRRFFQKAAASFHYRALLEHDCLRSIMLSSFFHERFHGSIEPLRDSISSHIALG